jgi:cell shape-determining protein MreC
MTSGACSFTSRMIKNRSVLIILGIFSLLFLLTQWWFVPKTYVNSRIITALQAPAVFFRSLQNRSVMVSQLRELVLENQGLRGQLSQLKNEPLRIVSDRQYLYARVYSSYPFNNADRVIINAGSEHGVRVGMLAVVREGVFFGEVVSVTNKTSEVQTIFSPEVRLEARVGPENISSLLEGGYEPKLTLISKKKPASTGQQIILASKKYPYGLLLGQVGAISESGDKLFDEALLRVPYIMSELNDIFIML